MSASLPTPSRFLRDTAIRPLGDRRYGATIDRGWWIQRGPNGGYIAAIIVRAAMAAIDDAARLPRSLTIHYVSPPAEGPAELVVNIERQGRSLTTVTVRLEQDGVTRALALLAASSGRKGPEFDNMPFPHPPPPETLRSAQSESFVPMHDKYETRQVLGPPPFSGGATADLAGWIRLAEPTPLDPPVVAALADAWVPAVFAKVTEPVAVPTVDLTVHFRNPVPSGLAPDTWCYVRFTSRLAAGGFVEEDGEVWSADGTLLAQSRQLAVLLEAPIDP
jgi:acyl-CoA thioesterase